DQSLTQSDVMLTGMIVASAASIGFTWMLDLCSPRCSDIEIDSDQWVIGPITITVITVISDHLITVPLNHWPRSGEAPRFAWVRPLTTNHITGSALRSAHRYAGNDGDCVAIAS